MPTAVSMQQLEIRLTDCLAALEAKLRSCANAGYTDENKRSEVIARDILNILLGRTYELEPRVNSPGFDLRDSDEMSLVQITSNDTIRKVTDCLRTTAERVAKEADLRGYEIKILFLTTDSETTKKLKTDTIKRLPKLGLDLSCIDFDPEINLLDFNDLIRPLRENHVTREQMTQLSDLMDKYWPHIASQPAVTDRVQEIINQYADNFTAPLFMHRGSKTVTLQNMYVEPSFDDVGDLAHQFGTVTDSIHDFLWHKSREKIMVIEGDAAIGKTSLVSWMCYHAQAGDEEAQKLFQNSPVVCVRLRELEFEENEESADPILQYLNIPDAREFVRRYPDAILILDGADELGMVSSLNASRIGQFILNSCNSLAVRKLIVTSRPQILDSAALRSHLFSTRKITLAPFCIAKREQWLKHYMELGEMIPAETLEYVRNLTDQDSDGVANTPLALYLLVHCNFRDEFRDNLWALYHTIFSDAIIKTYYNTPVLGSDPVLNQAEATLNYAMVKEIAYTMFRNPGCERFHINRLELDECARAVGLEGADAERVKQTCVLCAYWKNSTDGALEFYHNNIRDFFLCEYICDTLSRSLDESLKCSDIGILVQTLCQILYHKNIPANVWALICLRLRWEANHYADNTFYAKLVRYPDIKSIPARLLESNILWDFSCHGNRYKNAKQAYFNSLFLYHLLYREAISKCDAGNIQLFTEMSVDAASDAKTLFTDWFDLLMDYHFIPPIGAISLLWNTIFDSIAWNGKTFCYASFDASTFKHTKFHRCTLENSEFFNCYLRKVLFYRGQMNNVKFKDTSLYHVDFMGTSFSQGQISNATISNAKYHTVRFDSVDFSGTRFRDTQFVHCHISGQNTKLDGTFFEHIHAHDCTFYDVNSEAATALQRIGFTEREWIYPPFQPDYELISSHNQRKENKL